MKKVTKEYLIRSFIDQYNPTPKQLRLFCMIVDIRLPLKDNAAYVIAMAKACTYEALNLTGYYSTNITSWKYNGNIEQGEDKRYRLTKNFKKSGLSLYQITREVYKERLERQRVNIWRLYNDNNTLKRKVRKAQEILNDIANTY